MTTYKIEFVGGEWLYDDKEEALAACRHLNRIPIGQPFAGTYKVEEVEEPVPNHPNRGRYTYWYFSPRGFANEYEIGIASTQEARDYYASSGYELIDRQRAIRELCNRGDEATKIHASVSIDGEDQGDRFEVARKIAKGERL